MKNKLLIAALIFPIVILGLITVNKYAKVNFGTELTIPIKGFDPRDILSGHYLIYRIDYGPNANCDYEKYTEDAYMCLKKTDGKYSSEIRRYMPAHYKDKYLAVIRGECHKGRFKAGIERFYIPENAAIILDMVVRNGKGKIVLSVTPDGKAMVKDLLIDDKSWKKYVDEYQEP